MSKRATVESLEIKRFCEQKKCSPQWARRLRARNDIEWQEFKAARAPVERAGSFGTADAMTDFERATYSKAQSWKIYQSALDLADEAVREGRDSAEIAALNRAVKEARAVYEAAAKHEKQMAVESRLWIPQSAVVGIRAALPQLSDVVQNMRTSIASKLPDHQRADFYAAFDSLNGTWNQGVQRVEDYIQSLLPVPC